MLTILPGAISRVNSPRLSVPAAMASASNASTAIAMACCRKFSGSISSVYYFRLESAPDQSSAPFSRCRKIRTGSNHKDQHLDEAGHPMVRKIAIDHRPGVQKMASISNRMNSIPTR